MKKILKENIRLILGSLSVLVYIGFVISRMMKFSNSIGEIVDADISSELTMVVFEALTSVTTFRVGVYTLVLVAVLFLIYKKQ